MILAIETIILCIIFFLLCFGGTGTDDKNLKSYSSYPDKVQNQIKEIIEYQGRFKESNKIIVFISNFLLFLPLFFILGLFIRENNFYHNFICLNIIGQSLNIFDLLIIDLLWWRNTKRIRFTKIPEKRIVSKSAETYTVVYSRIYLVSDNRHNRRIYIDAILRIKIAKPAEPVNGQDKRRISCAAVDSHARLC